VCVCVVLVVLYYYYCYDRRTRECIANTLSGERPTFYFPLFFL
jgi:hypothetical protein